MRAVYVTSELAPFAKTGGLADVAAALPAALAGLGVEMTVVIPLYRSVRRSGADLRPLDPPAAGVPLGPCVVEVGLEGAELEGARGDGGRNAPPVRLVCIRYDPYFDRPELYGEGGRGYPDNCQRFSLFSRAALVASEALGLRPDVFHANDWQSALVCAHLKTGAAGPEAEPPAAPPTGPGAKTLLTIHNMAYQGVFWKWDLPWTGLGWEHFTVRELEYYGRINLLKAGIVFADAVSTVSPTYAREIQTSSDYGAGLEGVLRTRAASVSGILNGIDTSEWDPETDARIEANYSASSLAGKAECKAALQRELGLREDARAPLMGSIGRLAEQKGMGLVVEAADDILALDERCSLAAASQLVVLGRGEPAIERRLAALGERYPDRVRFVNAFDEGLAHRIEAGCDVFLMPSRYEPCGLNQLYSMRYGTIPVVHRTGGLADTVEDSPAEAEGTGFVFGSFDADALVAALRRAVARYRRRDAWTALMRRAMGRDWSWARSAREYLRLYKSMAGRAPSRARSGRLAAP